MRQDTVLITGAAGFIGSRLAQRLVLEHDVDVRAFVHGKTGAKLARLARLPVDVVQGDVVNESDLMEAAEGCDAIVHCAMALDPETNVTGTRNAMEAADRHGVDPFVFLSSYVVHGYDPDPPVLTENSPLDPGDDVYSTTKKRAEAVVRRYERDRGVPAVVFRPGIVYGPHAAWTKRPVREIRGGATLVDGARTPANLMYVDNLVDALVAALRVDAARGETFLAVDDDTVTWRRYYADCADAVGDHPPLRDLSPDEIRTRRRKRMLTDSVVPPVRAAAYTGKHLLRETRGSDVPGVVYDELKLVPWAKYLVKRTPDGVKRAAKRGVKGALGSGLSSGSGGGDEGSTTAASRYSLPDDQLISFHTSETTVSNAKLKDVLGWEQRVPYGEAMERIGRWIPYEYPG